MLFSSKHLAGVPLTQALGTMYSSLVALSIAVGSWIPVPGGAWNPDAETIADAQARLEPAVSQQAVLENEELADWSKYSFQYQGREIDGHKLLFINGFCIPPPPDARERMVVVFDGGPCFFSAFYDPGTQSYVGVAFNGRG